MLHVLYLHDPYVHHIFPNLLLLNPPLKDLRYVPDPFKRIAKVIEEKKDRPRDEIINQVCSQVMEARPDWTESSAKAKGAIMVDTYFKTINKYTAANSNDEETSDGRPDTNNDDTDDGYEEDELRITESSLPFLAYRELQLACKERGLPAGGKGKLLQNRLLEHLRKHTGDKSAQAPAAVATTATKSSAMPIEPGSNPTVTRVGRMTVAPQRYNQGA